ncbi:MAG: NADPH-dependent F420 reductase [Acidobacteria bacterium]|nr:NADPH-dependent F420 reductase [Acidobacteriota bacterium]
MSEEKIAVIGGTGDLGFGLALRWAKAGLPILIGSREERKARAAAERVQSLINAETLPGLASGPVVEGRENAAAASQASLVVLAVPLPAQVAILKSIRGALRDAILVDTTVPLAANLGGRATRIVGVWQGSAAEQARELVPGSIPVLAAFHTLSATALQDLAAPLEGDILICGDDDSAKERFFPLVKLIPGLRPLDAGPLEMARIVEGLTALMISVNRRYGTSHAGIRITGLPPLP